MRTKLASGSLIDTVVTLAAAAMMTFAGFEMLAGAGAPAEPATQGAAVQGSAVPAQHVDEARG